ncbi:MAG: UDP-N-acetylmuramoyl-L-alanyl-D-glutamate--2,6-diaminopimelate ligase [Campylobacterota bacterium]|nr:UDP-N-acetylmuramoyl-L-alanyl-D-glutamate--2,6-diaminopimelate ligase [Campylobacterota bacterium]
MTISYKNKIFTDNSNEVSNNEIFVASKQNEKFVEDAKKNGCENFISSVELKNYFDFSSIKIVGITGTNGKTTTAAAIYSFLLDLGYKVALQGTRGFFINDERVEDYTLTTPVQLSNFNNIQKAIENRCDFFIMEVSSHAISQKRIEGLNFALKVHTNITQDHLDYHNTIEEYIEVKNSFFQDDTMKLINKDDKNIKFKMKNTYAYGAENSATYKVTAYSLKNGLHVAVQHFSNIVNYSSPMMGFFNVYNLTCAMASVHLLTKKPLQEICDVVEYFGGVAGRMEIVNAEPLVVVDFAHTPDGMKEVFISFATYDIITVFGAGGDRDRTKRPMMGKMATFYSKEVIITADNPRDEDPDAICDDIIKGCKDTKPVNYEVELNRKVAIEKAIEKAKKYANPVILILGKGDEIDQIIYDKRFPLNDKKIVEELFSK